MTCHDTGDGSVQVGAGAAGAGAATATLPLTDRQIILVGRPNVGKSTLFNLLTGSHQKTMNVPRTTVSVEVGTWALATGERVSITDLPGTYSLNPTSPDEEVTAHAVDDFAREIAAAEEDSHRLAVVVLDATALGSSLYLYAQTRLSGVPVVVALSMNDMAAASGTSVDPERLARALGAPVVPINPRLGRGAAELEAALDRVDRAPSALIPLPIFDDPAASLVHYPTLGGQCVRTAGHAGRPSVRGGFIAFGGHGAGGSREEFGAQFVRVFVLEEANRDVTRTACSGLHGELREPKDSGNDGPYDVDRLDAVEPHLSLLPEEDSALHVHGLVVVRVAHPAPGQPAKEDDA